MIEILDWPETPKRNKYPNGYQPKIDYWNHKLVKAIDALDPQAVEYAAGKLAYFVLRQQQVVERMNQLYK
jgi:hypothetical protein